MRSCAAAGQYDRHKTPFFTPRRTTKRLRRLQRSKGFKKSFSRSDRDMICRRRVWRGGGGSCGQHAAAAAAREEVGCMRREHASCAAQHAAHRGAPLRPAALTAYIERPSSADCMMRAATHTIRWGYMLLRCRAQLDTAGLN